MSWNDSLSIVVRLIAIPYGYTVVVWSAGAIAIGRYGWPRSGDVLMFVLGATLGYLTFALLAIGLSSSQVRAQTPLPEAALLNVVPIAPALLTALVAGKLRDRRFGYLLVPLTCTAVYVAGLVLLVQVVI